MRRDSVGQDGILPADWQSAQTPLSQLTIVGEASTKLSREFTSRHPEIPWQQIAGFRNKIVHDYFGFNLDTAWQIATVALPELNALLNPILTLELPDAPDVGAL